MRRPSTTLPAVGPTSAVQLVAGARGAEPVEPAAGARGAERSDRVAGAGGPDPADRAAGAGGAEPAEVADRSALDEPRLLRIQEVAADTGLTPRSIRYYEELGLLRPAGRSQGAYRLYDASDRERLRFIRGLRDDAGFSLAEIHLLLEDEDARIRDRERFREAGDADEKRAILRGLIDRVDRQVATLEEKAARLGEMVRSTRDRRDHLRAHLTELDGGPAAHLPGAPHREVAP
jgi:MerR family transcriptional regulator, repressor of the yfmOP operon